MSRETTPSPITSLTNPRVKAAVRLRDRAERDLTGLTIVDGAREILRALDAGVHVEQAFVATELLRSADGLAVADRLRHRPTTLEVSPAVLARVAFGQRSDGVVAIITTPTGTLDDLVVPDDPLVVVAESVEKPGNLGAIIRTADGAGATAVIAADARTDLFNPNAIRASLGTIFAVPVISAATPAVLDWLMDHGIRAVAARPNATLAYTDADLAGPLAIVLGSEADGLGEGWTDPRIEPVGIPMRGIADSLNVSIAAAVLLYEARRQRG
jgi:TrmH family RNA methyltransferase